MKDKLISFILWIIIWAIWCFTYNSFFNSNNWWLTPWAWWQPPQMDTSNMSDEQLESMANRMWITKDELKTQIDSWKDLRTIMQENRTKSWTWNTNTWSWNQIKTWTWENSRSQTSSSTQEK